VSSVRQGARRSHPVTGPRRHARREKHRGCQTRSPQIPAGCPPRLTGQPGRGRPAGACVPQRVARAGAL